jgi:hypothetical protein
MMPVMYLRSPRPVVRYPSGMTKSGNSRHLKAVIGNTPEWGLGAQINGIKVMNYPSTSDELDNEDLPNINCTQVAILSFGMA